MGDGGWGMGISNLEVSRVWRRGGLMGWGAGLVRMGGKDGFWGV